MVFSGILIQFYVYYLVLFVVFSGILIQFYVYYLVLFVVGFFYIYIWSMVRSLFLVMGRIDYTGRWIYDKK